LTLFRDYQEITDFISDRPVPVLPGSDVETGT